MEHRVAEIWQEALGLQQVGLYDNFFDLGGHSLLSMQVVAQLERTTGLKINPREIMLQTLTQLAAFCENQTESRQPHTNGGLARRLFGFLRTALPGMSAGLRN